MKLINYLNESFISELTEDKVLEILETKCKNNWKFTKKNRPVIFRRR